VNQDGDAFFFADFVAAFAVFRFVADFFGAFAVFATFLLADFFLDGPAAARAASRSSAS
jgi:hypothetical protein